MCDHNPNKEIQGSIVKFVLEYFKFSIFSKGKVEMNMEHNLSLSTPKGKYVPDSRGKDDIDLAWSKLILGQGGWL